MKNRLTRNGYESLIVLALVGIIFAIFSGCSSSAPKKTAMRPTATPEMLIAPKTAAPQPTKLPMETRMAMTIEAHKATHPTAVTTPTPRPPMDLRPTATSALVRGNASSSGVCTIKGNVNSKGERIYHCPNWRDYDETEIIPAEGDRWFCSEAEAQASGFRRPKNLGILDICKP